MSVLLLVVGETDGVTAVQLVVSIGMIVYGTIVRGADKGIMRSTWLWNKDKNKLQCNQIPHS